MNAFEKAMAAIEKAMGRGKPARRATKSVKKTATPSRPEVRSGKPVVSAGRRGRTAGEPAAKQPGVTRVRALKREKVGHRPPRSAQPDVEQLVDAPLPTPPEAPGEITAPLYLPPIIDADHQVERMGCVLMPIPPLPVARPSWANAWERGAPPAPPAAVVTSSSTGRVPRGSCKAIDAKTGRQCRLLAHPETPDQHANERGAFHLVLQPGQVPTLHQVLDQAATSNPHVEVYNGASHVAGERLPTGGLRDSSSGGLSKAITKARKSAHAGETTEAHP